MAGDHILLLTRIRYRRLLATSLLLILRAVILTIKNCSCIFMRLRRNVKPTKLTGSFLNSQRLPRRPEGETFRLIGQG